MTSLRGSQAGRERVFEPGSVDQTPLRAPQIQGSEQNHASDPASLPLLGTREIPAHLGRDLTIRHLIHGLNFDGASTRFFTFQALFEFALGLPGAENHQRFRLMHRSNDLVVKSVQLLRELPVLNIISRNLVRFMFLPGADAVLSPRLPVRLGQALRSELQFLKINQPAHSRCALFFLRDSPPQQVTSGWVTTGATCARKLQSELFKLTSPHAW